VEKVPKENCDIHMLLQSLMVTLDDFTAGPIPLRELVNGSRYSSLQEFITFLKVLEVYGSGYEYEGWERDEVKVEVEDKPKKATQNKEEFTDYVEKAIIALSEVISVIEILRQQ
jgi:hypothetical protein